MVLVATKDNTITQTNHLKLVQVDSDANKENNINQNNIPSPLTPKQSAPVPVVMPPNQRQPSPRQQAPVVISSNLSVVTAATTSTTTTTNFTPNTIPNNPFINCTVTVSNTHQNTNNNDNSSYGKSNSDFHPRPSNHKRDSQLLSNSMPSLSSIFHSQSSSGSTPTPPATPRFIEDGPHEYIGSPDRQINMSMDKPLKKSRNSQTILRLDHLSIDQGIPSPLSRSTSELSIADNSNDVDFHFSSTSSTAITRSNTFCGEFPSLSTNRHSRNSRQLDFSAPHNIPNQTQSLPFNFLHHQSVSSPSSPLLLPTQVEPFSISAPNTFLLSGAYPNSPDPSPSQTPVKDHHTPLKLMQTSPAALIPATPNITMTLADAFADVASPTTPFVVNSISSQQSNSPIATSPSQSSTPLIELLNNCESVHTGSPYKTPSKSHSHFVSRFSDSTYVATQSLYQSSDSVFNFKKRGRTELFLSQNSESSSGNNHNNNSGFIAPSIPTSKSFINFSTTSSELSNSGNNNHNELNTNNNNSENNTVSPNTWKKASPDVSKPLPFPFPLPFEKKECGVFITNSNVPTTNEDSNGASEYNLRLPLCNGKPGYNNIAPEILSKLMEDVKNNITVVDCRYSYEYNGGHIKNAINIPPHSSSTSIQKHFFDKPPANNKRIIIFHCEFSSKRAPDCYSLFRDMDRKNNCYPNVHYPEIYLLTGGYKRFFETFPEKCTKDYIKMDDPRFINEKRKEEEKKKKEEAIRSRFGRSQSFHY